MLSTQVDKGGKLVQLVYKRYHRRRSTEVDSTCYGRRSGYHSHYLPISIQRDTVARVYLVALPLSFCLGAVSAGVVLTANNTQYVR